MMFIGARETHCGNISGPEADVDLRELDNLSSFAYAGMSSRAFHSHSLQKSLMHIKVYANSKRRGAFNFTYIKY